MCYILSVYKELSVYQEQTAYQELSIHKEHSVYKESTVHQELTACKEVSNDPRVISTITTAKGRKKMIGCISYIVSNVKKSIILNQHNKTKMNNLLLHSQVGQASVLFIL